MALAYEDDPQSSAGVPRATVGGPRPSRDVPLTLFDSFARLVLALTFLDGILAHLYTGPAPDNDAPARAHDDPSAGGGDPSRLDNGSGVPGNRPGSEHIQGQGGAFARGALLILVSPWLFHRFP